MYAYVYIYIYIYIMHTCVSSGAGSTVPTRAAADAMKTAACGSSDGITCCNHRSL